MPPSNAALTAFINARLPGNSGATFQMTARIDGYSGGYFVANGAPGRLISRYDPCSASDLAVDR